MEVVQFYQVWKLSQMVLTPLSRPIFIYANNSAKEREEVKEFISFYLKKC